MKLTSSLPLAIAALSLVASVHAMGVGQGETKVDFNLKISDLGSSRLHAKLNVQDGVSKLPAPVETGKGHHGRSGNFALAGDKITITIGTPSYTGTVNTSLPAVTADDKGRVKGPLDIKLVANGAIMQIEADGLDLVTLFALDKNDGAHTVTVQLTISATPPAAAGSTTPPAAVVLYNNPVTFNYTVKNGKVKGRNF